MNYKKNYEKKILKELFQEMKTPALWEHIKEEDNESFDSDRFKISGRGLRDVSQLYFIYIKQKQEDDFPLFAIIGVSAFSWNWRFRQRVIKLRHLIKMGKGHIDNSLSGGELSDLENEGGE